MIDPTTSSDSFYNCKNSKKALKTAAATAFFCHMVKDKPIVLASGAFMGLAFPQESSQKINRVWDTLFNPEINKEDSSWGESIYNALPLVTAVTIGFFTLPTLTYPALAFTFSVQLGACGFRLDRVLERNDA